MIHFPRSLNFLDLISKAIFAERYKYETLQHPFLLNSFLRRSKFISSMLRGRKHSCPRGFSLRASMWALIAVMLAGCDVLGVCLSMRALRGRAKEVILPSDGSECNEMTKPSYY
jgi:hypothetical protein